MINDDVLMKPSTKRISFLFLCIAHAKANEPQDHVICINSNRVIAQANAIAGCSLACNCDVVIPDSNWALQGNGA